MKTVLLSLEIDSMNIDKDLWCSIVDAENQKFNTDIPLDTKLLENLKASIQWYNGYRNTYDFVLLNNVNQLLCGTKGTEKIREWFDKGD